MKPLGRKYFKGNTCCKRDFHPNRKYYINWWEDVCTPNKDLERRLVKKEIKEQLSP